jgi:hypothetical protein
MKMNIIGKTLFGLVLVIGGRELYGADMRTVSIDINLIIDGSSALTRVRDDISSWISGNLVDQRLREGDRLTIWKAGKEAEIVYSDTLKSEADKENIKKVLKNFSAAGDAADFSGALRDAVSRSTGRGIIYTLLVTASPAALSPTLQGPNAGLIRFSRIEETRGWQALVVALNIDSRVRQAASAYFLGS